MPCKCLFLFIKGYDLLGRSPSYSTLTFGEMVLIPQSISAKFCDIFLAWKIREDWKIKCCWFVYI